MPASEAAQSQNMKLLAHHTLNGHGGMGEGMGMQLAKDGRRVLWLAHESAPKNFTGVDVTDPRKPKVVVQTDLPHAKMRSNSLETAGDLMAVAYQVTDWGAKPAGFELFDISEPERPRSVSRFDASGPNSRGCHQLWFADGKTVHMACSDPDLKPRDLKDDPGLPPGRRQHPAEAGGRGPLAPAGHHGRRRRAAAAAPAGEIRRRLSRAQHQRLSGAPGPLLPRLPRRRHDGARHLRPRAAEDDLALDQFAALQRLHAYRAAALRPRPARGDRRGDPG